ncbi:hypothetical protein HF1_03520 [Mycoplasma haemofelis str. Langford 1]|uniref:Uncharacterized protein n=1 Tax=Mycoplasma haemofelis (strain Langford 1) TaxID=941640 RepID=E8ZGT9_MYCHL|nr:hypothetical protein [Mycoplasma haemofelis]CBY92360.1 hypothetical protein HF1_03520 [Mycoplasma haemofelis str. Langford 1]
MNKLGLASAIGAAGAGFSYAGYSYFSSNAEDTKITTTIGGKWSKFWIDTSSGDMDGVWENKKGKLMKANEDSLHENLKKLKSAFNAQELKAWCDKASDSDYDKTDDIYLANVRSYCTFDIQDKLINKVIKDEGHWSTANDSLQVVVTENLSPAMAAIKYKLESAPTVDSNALKSWCSESYVKSWLGDEDSDFQDTKAYCTILEGTES